MSFLWSIVVHFFKAFRINKLGNVEVGAVSSVKVLGFAFIDQPQAESIAYNGLSTLCDKNLSGN